LFSKLFKYSKSIGILCDITHFHSDVCSRYLLHDSAVVIDRLIDVGYSIDSETFCTVVYRYIHVNFLKIMLLYFSVIVLSLQTVTSPASETACASLRLTGSLESRLLSLETARQLVKSNTINTSCSIFYGIHVRFRNGCFNEYFCYFAVFIVPFIGVVFSHRRNREEMLHRRYSGRHDGCW